MTGQESETLRTMLKQRNAALLRDWVELESSMSAAQVPLLLEPYRTKMVDYCSYFRMDTENIRALLQLPDESILEDLLSKTQVSTNYLRIISSKLASPVLRCSTGDVLCLKIITWIHQSHQQTVNVPAAFVSGDVAIWPMMGLVPIYSFPSLEQGGLLFQPLHFHEFGHGLYVLHKPEMDDLIKELQESLTETLTPLSQRNDRNAGGMVKKRQNIVNRWFDWGQEIFCDAVGLTIGGPAYLYAFSAYCNNLSKNDLYLESEDMERSKHPVTWLRIRLLVKRAQEMGLLEAASRVEQEWNTLASVMQITEDYHGYFENEMENEVHRVIDDMLIVASPRRFLSSEVAQNATANDNVKPDDTPVTLVNYAWHIHNKELDTYAIREEQAKHDYLAGT